MHCASEILLVFPVLSWHLCVSPIALIVYPCTRPLTDDLKFQMFGHGCRDRPENHVTTGQCDQHCCMRRYVLLFAISELARRAPTLFRSIGGAILVVLLSRHLVKHQEKVRV